MQPRPPSSPSPSWIVRAAIDHPWRVVLAWVAVLAAAVAIVATSLGGVLGTAQVVTNDPESARAQELIDDHVQDGGLASEILVVSSDEHEVGSPAFDAFLAKLVVQAPKIGVALPQPPEGGSNDATGADALPRSKDGHAVLIPLTITADDEEEAAAELIDAARAADRDPDFSVEVTGAHVVAHDLNLQSESDLREGELFVGLPVAMIVLLLVFGTLVGALMPLLVAVVAIVCALALAALVGQQWELSVFLVNMVSGMGLALGIDYSLFVVSRYREERLLGSDRDAAIRTTSATAGRAVLFSGITFVISLTGMLLVPTNIMASLALGAILVGITAVLAALTLLPAILRLLGDRVNALRVPLPGARRRQEQSPDAASHGFWGHLVLRVMAHPVLWGGTVLVLLVALSVPLLGIHTGASGVATFPEDLASRRGFDALHEQFPQQAFSPARVVVHDARLGELDDELDASVARLRKAVAGDDRFGEPSVTRSTDGELAVVEVPVGADSLSEDAVAAVRDLRAHVLPAAFAGMPDSTQVLVTGETAFNIDYFDVTREWTPIVLGFVLGLSFLVLLVVFRSLAVPVVAILLNLASVGATYGLLVLVFQHGVGAGLLGLQQVDTTEAWVPLFLFSVLFGLSMDYHMFLMTRIRERWALTGDTRDAVAWGVGSTGRIITGAALIIVAVFVGFAVGDLVMFQQMGFGVAVALLIDATLVRGVLLPAAMALLGERNWYLPRWLRWLPEVQLEGAPAGGTGHHHPGEQPGPASPQAPEQSD